DLGETAVGEPGDQAWRARIDVHRARRPPSWRTVELGRAGDLAGLLDSLDGPVLVDSLGVWAAGFGNFVAPTTPLCEVLGARGRRGEPTVLVSEEVGLGVHPVTPAGRTFADALGTLNQAVAAVADRTVLVVAGRTLLLDGSR
ncbi:MAG: bifunctional adenosylcobinamide kinase/adenosylcobinamide-phosphate guanylyltransferase, partial [Actinomycetota bacterium]|nr:bifunctional adenosylcobinamide kinase/adenosylcobinamide-phosphate guanylyltransferase [Actinomycetota bacterium]